MKRMWLVAGTAAMTLALLAAVEPSLAMAMVNVPQTSQTSQTTTDIGKNLGNELKSWGGPLLLATSGLMSIPVVAKKDWGQGMTLVGLTAVAGGFILAEDVVKGIIRSLWQVIGAG